MNVCRVAEESEFYTSGSNWHFAKSEIQTYHPLLGILLSYDKIPGRKQTWRKEGLVAALSPATVALVGEVWQQEHDAGANRLPRAVNTSSQTTSSF